jgi:hypothetical protein
MQKEFDIRASVYYYILIFSLTHLAEVLIMETTTNFVPYIVMVLNILALAGVFSYGIYCVSSGSCPANSGGNKS